MAKTYTDTNNSATGTATSPTVWSNSGSSTFFSGDRYKTFNDIYGSKNSSKPKVKVRDLPKKGVWDGVEWKEFKTWMPRKSITGKIIIGKMHKRSKKGVIKGGLYQQANVKHTVLDRRTSHTQYAKTKELFEGKLKGTA